MAAALAQGIAYSSGLSSLDELNPNKRDVTVALSTSLAAAGAAGVGARLLFPRRLEWMVAATAGALGAFVGVQEASVMNFLPDQSVAWSYTWFYLTILFPMAATILATYPLVPRPRGSGLFAAAGLALAAFWVASLTAAAIFVLVHVERFSREAHEAHLRDTPTPSLAFAVSCLVLAAVASLVRSRRS